MTFINTQTDFNENNFVEELLEQLPSFVFWKNKEGVYLGCNNAFANAVGLSCAAEVVGKTDYDLPIKKEDSDTFRKDDQQIIKTREPKFNIEETQTFLDNRQFILLTNKVPLLNKDKEVIGILGVYNDITERKKLESELVLSKAQAEAAKQNEEELRKAAMIFAGSVAHDLTTPLTNVNLMANNLSNIFTELLKIEETAKTIKNALNDMQFSYLEKFPQSLQTQLTELNEYIKDSLKALNKTVSGIKTQDDLVKCELWRCMQKVIDEYPYLENEKDLIHWDTTYLFNFMGNPLLFYRIMFNLIKNSLYQIQEKGHGEIFIRAEQTDTHNVLYFKDTAGGVTQKTVDNIFNSYQTTKAEGTGVGLAFCKLTMQSFGGEMNCRLVDGDHIEFKLEFIKT